MFLRCRLCRLPDPRTILINKLFHIVFILLLLLPCGVLACFGPKLYVGTQEGAQADLLYELASLYVKEKTGVETVRVPLEGKDPLAELHAERLDLAFAPAGGEGVTELLAVAGYPVLVSGRRPLEELQFTTVAPALRKLDGLLQPKHLTGLVARVDAGAPPAATARRFLMEQGWI